MATASDRFSVVPTTERPFDPAWLLRVARLARLSQELLLDGIRLAAAPPLIPLTAGSFLASLVIDTRLHEAVILGCCLAAGLKRLVANQRITSPAVAYQAIPADDDAADPGRTALERERASDSQGGAGLPDLDGTSARSLALDRHRTAREVIGARAQQDASAPSPTTRYAANEIPNTFSRTTSRLMPRRTSAATSAGTGLLGPLPIFMLLLALAWHRSELQRRSLSIDDRRPSATLRPTVANEFAPPQGTAPRTPPRPSIDLERMLAEQVRPAFEECRAADRRAVADFVRRVDEQFSRYRVDVAAFADELTWCSTRFGIATRAPGDWWYEDGRLHRFLAEIFERQVFSTSEFESALSAALVALRDELDAARNRLLLRLRVVLDDHRATDVILPTAEAFRAKMALELERVAETHGREALYAEVERLLVSETASIVTASIVAKVVSRWVTTAAVSTVAGGSATAGATVVGGGGGSTVGPVGTAIGIVAGLLVGMAVDEWMADRFRERVCRDLRTRLSEMERELLAGDGRSDGLEARLSAAIESCAEAREMIIERHLKEYLE